VCQAESFALDASPHLLNSPTNAPAATADEMSVIQRNLLQRRGIIAPDVRPPLPASPASITRRYFLECMVRSAFAGRDTFGADDSGVHQSV
jgi:hypothetical protein